MMATNKSEDGKRVALIAGASGLVGGFLLERLLRSPLYEQVVAVTRRPLTIKHPKLHEIISEFDDVEVKVKAAGFKPTDAFCALGTTIKRAGSQAAFRKVDFEYVVRFARAAKAAGAQRFLLVTAVGASARSSIFYSRVKGEVEEAVSAMGFEAVHIFRPSMLMGNRDDKRPGETIAKALTPYISPFLIGPASIYKGIEAETVAAAMAAAARTATTGFMIHHYNEMQKLKHAEAGKMAGLAS